MNISFQGWKVKGGTRDGQTVNSFTLDSGTTIYPGQHQANELKKLLKAKKLTPQYARG